MISEITTPRAVAWSRWQAARARAGARARVSGLERAGSSATSVGCAGIDDRAASGEGGGGGGVMTPAFRLTSVKVAVAGVLDPFDPAATPMRNGSGRAKRDSPATVHWMPSVEYEPTKRLASGGPGCSIFSRRSQTGALMPGLMGDTVAMRLLLARLWN